MKTEGSLQLLARQCAKWAWPVVLVASALVSLATPLVSPKVSARWIHMPELITLLPIPLMTGVAMLGLRAILNSQRVLGKLCWLPFGLMVLVKVMLMVMVLGFLGLAYSLSPFVMMDSLTIWQAAAAPKSLALICGAARSPCRHSG